MNIHLRVAGASMLQLLKFRFRRAEPNAKPTFFFHIPKCAGSTLWEVIWDIYGTRNVFLAKSKKQHARLAAMSMERRRGYSAIGGHGSLSFFRKMLGDMERYHKIVTLRDPIDRVISEYNYIRTWPEHPLHDKVAILDFDAYLDKAAPRNRQVKLLTGSSDDSEGAIEIVTRFFDDWSMSADVGAMAGRLYQVTGMSPRPIAHKNRATLSFSRRDVAPATLRLLEEQNRHDLVLLDALRRARG